MHNSFDARKNFQVGDKTYRFYRLDALKSAGVDLAKLPFSLKILLENLLRNEDGNSVTHDDILDLAQWDPEAVPSHEIAFRPSRVLLQDFTGVPAVVDLAAMRDAMNRLGGDPKKINPLQPVDLVIDHSVQVDEAGTPRSLLTNTELEYQRNKERYAFLRWGQTGFDNFRVVPPETGIVHQVNLEYLARVVFTDNAFGDPPIAYPDTLVGTDSHTTMINGLGVLGWGVGGIEAEAAMLGQPVSMLVPQVVGFKLAGQLPEGATATDLVLTVTQMLRRKGVVGKFVEFFGEGLAHLPLADRATIANMAPEYGATCGIFPIDAETLRYLELTSRPEEQIRLVEAYCKEQGLFHTPDAPEAEYSDTLELDLSTIEPSLAGPKRPQDRVLLRESKEEFGKALKLMLEARPSKKAPLPVAGSQATAPTTDLKSEIRLEGEGGGGTAVGAEDPDAPAAEERPAGLDGSLTHGSVVIAAITSCTNTSNPSVMVAAGLVAKKAVEKGLTTKPWVKTSLAPGSKVVTEYLRDSGLDTYLDQLRFNLVGYGCTTCIGNSGPLPAEISHAIREDDLVAAAVLSGNRNFEGRINSDVRANYLASPPLVVAYALAGTMDIDLTTEPIGRDKQGQPVFLRDIWPTQKEVHDTILKSVRSEMFRSKYAQVFEGDEPWRALPVPGGDLYAWDEASTYVKNPPYFQDMGTEPPPVSEIKGARVLALLGDSITTDHISPAGAIKVQSPAGQYLIQHGVEVEDFNSYGSRRGNHEVMVRGTFANIRLRNQLAPGTEGGFTRHLPDGQTMSIFEASELYQQEGVPLLVLAGKEYGSGSSRDWAAKGPALLGVRAVIAESFERIHRSNLVGMGILPLQFGAGDNAESLGLNGEETYTIEGLVEGLKNEFAEGREVTIVAERADGVKIEFEATVRIDTPQEIRYYEHGGILPYVLRQLLSRRDEAPASGGISSVADPATGSTPT